MDIEDASVLEIVRSGDELRIVLDRGEVLRRDASSERTGRLDLLLRGITLDRAVKYTGAGVEGPHPDPTHPLDAIATVEYSTGKLTLQGYLRHEPWYCWELAAKDLVVSWANTIANAI